MGQNGRAKIGRIFELAKLIKFISNTLIEPNALKNVNSCWNTEITPYLEQGILTEGEGLVQLTSSLRLLVL